MLTLKTFKTLVSLAAIVAVAGCNGMDQSSSVLGVGDGQAKNIGKLKVLMARDADLSGRLLDVAKAEIVVNAVSVRSVDGELVNYVIDPATIDLMAIREGFGLTFFRGLVPPGEYDHIRFQTASEGVVTFKDGTHAAFSIPSGAQSGLKIFFDGAPLVVLDNAISVLILETDLMDSFVFTGSGAVLFKPVLRVSVLDPIVLDTPPVTSEDPVGDGSGEGEEIPLDDGSSVVTQEDFVEGNFSPWLIGV